MREEAEKKIDRRYLALLSLVALALVLSLLVRPVGPARAAFPGQNGNIVFVSDRDGDSEIRKLSKCLICMTRLTNNTAEDFAPSVSPDGNKIAFVSDRDGNYEIYSMNTDGTGQQRLTNNAAIDANPTWTPDGSRIAFQSDRDGAYDQSGNYAAEVYVMDSDDGTDQTRLTHNPMFDGDPAYSPDGTRIAFTSNRSGNPEIYVMKYDGSDPENLTENPAEDSHADWSPNGSR